jgi:16S rRNA (cytosine1402-N4)-methyltransferase
METKVSGEPHPHLPVLYHEVLKALNPETGSKYIDGTLGAGGHSRGILELSAPAGELLGLDLDPIALGFAKSNLSEFSKRAHIFHNSYLEMKKKANSLGWQSVNGILLDLGVSSIQLDNPEKGFSFRKDAPLDMRFDPTTGMTAADIINNFEEQELLQILWDYGEEQNARRIVRGILAARPFTTTRQLADLVEKTTGRSQKGIHPATRTFQALRIAVNNELESITSVLPIAMELLSPGGRLAVITFHSLEDRIVKHYFQQESKDCICPPEFPVCQCGHKAILRVIKPNFIQPDENEVKINPRARSAKLRVAEKLMVA